MQTPFRRFKLIIILFILAVVISCKKELLVSPLAEKKKAIDKEIRIENVSYSRFLSSINLDAIGNLKETFSKPINTNKQIQASGNSILSGFILNTDSVKKLMVKDTVSYIFTIKPATPRAISFTNLTIQEKNGKTNAFLTTYTPTKEWVKNWRERHNIEFKGQITNKKINLNAQQSNRQVQSSTKRVESMLACTTYYIYVTVDYPCIGPPIHYPGQPGCVLEGQDGGPYSVTNFTSVTSCEEVDTFSIPDTGSGGGGGSTSPTPPPTYNPCNGDQLVAAANGKKVDVAAQPTECDTPDPGSPYPITTTPIIGVPNDYETIFDNESGATYTFGEIRQLFENNLDLVDAVEAEENIPPLTLPVYGTLKSVEFLNEYRALSILNPTWSKSRVMAVAAWNVFKGDLHFTLDILGMAPIAGEAADITNGVIYFLDGDHINGAMSIGAAVPIWGWVSTGGKWVKSATQTLSRPLTEAFGKAAYRAIKTSKGAVRFVKVPVTAFSHNALTFLRAVKPADNTLTNLSRQMLDQLAHRIKPVAQSLKNKVDDIVLNGDATGTLTENLSDEIFETNGFLKHNAKFGSNNGFDGVYIKQDAAGNIQEIVINEAKQVGTGGNIKLNPANLGTDLKAQMSDAWIRDVIGKLKTNSSTSDLGNKLEILFQNNRNLFTKTVTGVDKATGEIVVLKLQAY